MSSINTNIPSLIAQRVFGSNNRTLADSLNKLSTGLRINTGRDDPSGLIASEGLRAEKVAITAALTNITRANNVIGVAEGALNEINTLLTELEDLVGRSANRDGITTDERDANQLQIDTILESVNRIASSTEFQGKKLLSGELAYNVSGVDSAEIVDLNITSARLPDNASRQVLIDVVSSAQVGTVNYGSATTDNFSTTTLEIAGNRGTEVLSFAASTSIADVATAVNNSSALTGVSAFVSGANISFSSTEYGSDQYASVRALQGAFAVTGGTSGKDFGENAAVNVNGVAASTQGLEGQLQTSTFALEFRLTSAFGTQTTSTSTFDITGGGALFQISPDISVNGQANLGIKGVSTSSLGSNALGFLSSLGSGQTNSLASENFAAAQDVLRSGQKQVAELRGRLGAFQKNTLATAANALAITFENTTAAESAIRDVDFAAETSRLTKAQILSQSATNTLRIANQLPQQILALLG